MNQKLLSDNRLFCVVSEESCPYWPDDKGVPDTSTLHSKQKGAFCKNIFICLKCNVLKKNLSNNPILSNFLNILKNQFVFLKQKVDLDQMILNKLKFSLERIQRQSEGLNKEQYIREKILSDRIIGYEALLAKREVYLHTLKRLSDIINKRSQPNKIWESAADILVNEIADLEGVGLIIINKDIQSCNKYYTSLVPTRLSNLIEKCIKQGDCFYKLLDKKEFLNFYQIYWECNHNKNRLGPLTQDILERSFLFPIKHHLSLEGIFIILMKNLASSVKELSAFFYIVAKLTAEGIIYNS